MVQYLRPVRLVPARAALRLAVPPVECDPLAIGRAEVVPAPGALVQKAALGPPRGPAADVVAAVVRRVRRDGPRPDALGPTGAAMGGRPVGIAGERGVDPLGLVRMNLVETRGF